MKFKRMPRILIGIALLALYELFLDGSGVGMKERWNKLRRWSDK